MSSTDDKPYPTKPHERRDINVRAIYRFIAILTAIAIVTHILLWGLFVWFERADKAKDPPISPLAREERQQPPAPRLQVTPLQDYQAIRTNEENLLNSYGWVDKQKGIVRIPVEQAMKIVIEKDLLNKNAKQQ